MTKKCNIENCRGCDYEPKNKINKIDIIMLVLGVAWLAVIVLYLAHGGTIQ